MPYSSVTSTVAPSDCPAMAVLMAFIAMKVFGVDANIVALSGIAISIGVMVDVGVVFTENIVRHLEMPENKLVKGKKLVNVIYAATTEVAGSVITALATTIVSFLPVFTMTGAGNSDPRIRKAPAAFDWKTSASAITWPSSFAMKPTGSKSEMANEAWAQPPRGTTRLAARSSAVVGNRRRCITVIITPRSPLPA